MAWSLATNRVRNCKATERKQFEYSLQKEVRMVSDVNMFYH